MKFKAVLIKVVSVLVCLVAATHSKPPSLQAEALPPQLASAGKFSELSKSIVAEAQSLYPFARPYGLSGTLESVLASAASSHSPANADGAVASPTRMNPSNVASMLPAVPVVLADGTLNGTLGPGITALRYQGDRTRAAVTLGLGYLKEDNADATMGGNAELAVLPYDNFALGTGFTRYVDRNDLIVSGVWQLPDSGLRFKATGGYLWGNRTFDFVSGPANVNLEQFGYVFSTQYVIPKSEEINCLHSIGFSLWGARAHQTTSCADGPRYFIVETADYYLVKNDPMALSEGRLFGASADAQVALLPNLVGKGSIGYEQLRFPFADGTSELNRSVYYNVDFLYELFPDVVFGTGYRSGAGEDRISASVKAGEWQFSAFQNIGQNGIPDNRGIMLTFHLGVGGGKKQQGSLAMRMQPNRRSDRSALLAAATARPAQLPQSFLAKVDLTAVSEVAKISKAGLPSGATVDSSGDVYLTVGTGMPTLAGVTRNGVAYSPAMFVTTTATHVVVHTRQLPAGSATYVLSVTSDTAYYVTIQYQGD